MQVIAAPPPSWYHLYNSHGAVVELLETPPACTNKTCIDWDTGDAVCCTGNAMVSALCRALGGRIAPCCD